jgi:hypothetical protein
MNNIHFMPQSVFAPSEQISAEHSSLYKQTEA